MNAISPNAKTRMVASIPDDKMAYLVAQIPMGRFAEAEEMAAAIISWPATRLRYITGTVLPGRRWHLDVVREQQEPR